MSVTERRRTIAAIGFGVALALAAAALVAMYGRRAPQQIAAPMPGAARDVLDRYIRAAETQPQKLASYSDTEVIDAELPGVHKKGEFVLRGRFRAPRQLKFKPVSYTGDGFVKTNVILGYLGRRVEHLQKGEGQESAITPENFNFDYNGDGFLNGVRVAVFEVHAKRVGPGLFDGRIFLNAGSGELLRAEGKFVKSPSMFIKDVTFVKDYGQFDGFTLPTHVHSESDTHIAGRAVLDIYHRDYQVEAASQNAAR